MPPRKKQPPRRRKQRGGAGDPEQVDDAPPRRASPVQQLPPAPMELGPTLPAPEKERISRRRNVPVPPPELLRPGPPPRADAPPPPAPPQIPEGVLIIRREMDALIKEITEGVRRTTADVSEADRLTEINDRLVSFVTNVMEALSRLLEHIDAYKEQMTELTKQLRAFGSQVGKTSGKTDKAAKDAAVRLGEFRNMVSKSLDGMKKHLRAEDMAPLQLALKNWNELTKGV